MAGLTDSATIASAQAPVVTTWFTTSNASPTPLNSNVVFTAGGMDTIALTIITTAGITGGVITFEVFDGASWFPVKCARLSTYNTDSSYILVGGATQGWTVPVAGYPQFRFRLSTQATGGANDTVVITSIVSAANDVSVVTAGIDPNSTLPTPAANATTSNGLSVARTAAITTTAVQAVKATGGKVHNIIAAGANSGNFYMKLYNTTSPTVGTTTPAYTIAIPSAGLNIFDQFGMTFSTAISYAITGAYADTDTTAPTAGITVQVEYV